MSAAKTLGKTFATVGALGLGSLAWGTLIERKLYSLREQDVAILPSGCAPLRVLHISDLHLAPWQQDKVEWLQLLEGIKPDLVVSTGDSMGHPDALPQLKVSLAPLAGIPGVFVYGSNDYFGPSFKNPLRYITGTRRKKSKAVKLDVQAQTDFLTGELGWLNLNNDAAVIDLNDLRLEFFGVDDPHIMRDDLVSLPGVLDELRENTELPESSLGTVTIGVTHAPYRRVLDAFTTQGAQVIFAGHTHGGQVRVPGLKYAPVTNCDIPADFARGLNLWQHARKSSYLTVSAGLGTSIYAPIRFGCLPEATLLTLHAV